MIGRDRTESFSNFQGGSLSEAISIPILNETFQSYRYNACNKKDLIDCTNLPAFKGGLSD